jgi:hypothetical protein
MLLLNTVNGRPERILAGFLVDDSINFRFQVMAYRALTQSELTYNYRLWRSQRDKRCSLRNVTITVISNAGWLELGYT